MCAPYCHRDPRTRLMMVIANFSLVAGVLLLDLARHLPRPTPGWLDALTGLFFGLSIAANLFAARRARRCAS
jgi:hypothetical protein